MFIVWRVCNGKFAMPEDLTSSYYRPMVWPVHIADGIVDGGFDNFALPPEDLARSHCSAGGLASSHCFLLICQFRIATRSFDKFTFPLEWWLNQFILLSEGLTSSHCCWRFSGHHIVYSSLIIIQKKTYFIFIINFWKHKQNMFNACQVCNATNSHCRRRVWLVHIAAEGFGNFALPLEDLTSSYCRPMAWSVHIADGIVDWGFDKFALPPEDLARPHCSPDGLTSSHCRWMIWQFRIAARSVVAVKAHSNCFAASRSGERASRWPWARLDSSALFCRLFDSPCSAAASDMRVLPRTRLDRAPGRPSDAAFAVMELGCGFACSSPPKYLPTTMCSHSQWFSDWSQDVTQTTAVNQDRVSALHSSSNLVSTRTTDKAPYTRCNAVQDKWSSTRKPFARRNASLRSWAGSSVKKSTAQIASRLQTVIGQWRKSKWSGQSESLQCGSHPLYIT